MYHFSLISVEQRFTLKIKFQFKTVFKFLQINKITPATITRALLGHYKTFYSHWVISEKKNKNVSHFQFRFSDALKLRKRLKGPTKMKKTSKSLTHKN